MLNLKDCQSISLEPIVLENGLNVIQYLSMEDKLVLIGNVVNNSIDENNYYNPSKVHIFYVLNVVKFYTDIDYGDMNVFDAYDRLCTTGIWQQVEKNIPATELKFIIEGIDQLIKNIQDYKNSLLGILQTVGKNYEELNIDGERLQKNLADPENLKLLKQILTKYD